MPSYMTLVVLALVASNVSPALSAPIRQVREQSLSHRQAAAAEKVAAAGGKSWGSSLKKYGKSFLIGTGATMAFAYIFEKLNGKAGSTAASDAAHGANPANTANPASSTPPTYSPTYSTPNTPTYSPPTTPTYSTSTGPTYYSTSTTPTYSPSTGSTYSPPQTQGGYQQRAVEHDLYSDIFDEPPIQPRVANGINDGPAKISRSSEARSTSDNNNQKGQTASRDLLRRTDLVEAIRLFSRMLEELD